mmetsp:Transcript_8031/g.12996  ORF Transcript_8031/g.12996 Transcript_8031/m.12996 type:complete len:206 (-) Transcript_8031:819-1436(-)
MVFCSDFSSLLRLNLRSFCNADSWDSAVVSLSVTRFRLSSLFFSSSITFAQFFSFSAIDFSASSRSFFILDNRSPSLCVEAKSCFCVTANFFSRLVLFTCCSLRSFSSCFFFFDIDETFCFKTSALLSACLFASFSFKTSRLRASFSVLKLSIISLLGDVVVGCDRLFAVCMGDEVDSVVVVDPIGRLPDRYCNLRNSLCSDRSR